MAGASQRALPSQKVIEVCIIGVRVWGQGMGSGCKGMV